MSTTRLVYPAVSVIMLLASIRCNKGTECQHPLLRDDVFPAHQVMSASTAAVDRAATYGVIGSNSGKTWCAQSNLGARIIVTFGRPVVVTAIQTQGFSGSWIKTMFLQYTASPSGSPQFYNQPPGTMVAMTANIDDVTIQQTNLSFPIIAHKVIFMILSYQTSVCARIQLLGCLPELQECAPGQALFEGECYVLHPQPADWSVARKTCQTDGADLALIENINQNTYLKRISNTTDLWVGLNAFNKGQFIWRDYHSSALPYRNWLGTIADPPVYSRELDCVSIVDAAKWEDADCETPFSYVCQIPGFASDISCTVAHNGDCYIFNTSGVTWPTAEHDCQKKNGYLAHIQTSAQNQFIYDELRNRSLRRAWIGLNDRADEGVMMWSTAGGTPVTLTFKDFQSNVFAQESYAMKCGLFLSNSSWIAESCTNTHAYVCQTPAGTCKFDALRPGDSLNVTSRLCSQYGRYEVKFNADMVLTIYDHLMNTSRPTGGSHIVGDKMVFYVNGSLVVLNGSDVTWSLELSGEMSHLAINSDGKLVIYSKFMNVIWREEGNTICQMLPESGSSQTFSASSTRSDTAPGHALIGFEEIPNYQVGAWCANTGDTSPWLQLDLGDVTLVNTILTQARNSSSLGYVADFVIRTSVDGLAWRDFMENGNIRHFTGNTRPGDSVVSNVLSTAVFGRYIRLVPTLDGGVSTCLRFGIYSCTENAAYRKSAFASDANHPAPISSHYLTDGDFKLLPVTCCRVMIQPWVMVDLGAMRLVRCITITTYDNSSPVYEVATTLLDTPWNYSVSALQQIHYITLFSGRTTSVLSSEPNYRRYAIVYSFHAAPTSLPITEVEVFGNDASFPIPERSSPWFSVSPGKPFTVYHHLLDRLPVMAQVLYRANTGVNAGFVQNLATFGQLVLVADHTTLHLVGMGTTDKICVGSEGWTRSFAACSSDAEIKVKLWSQCNLLDVAFTSPWIPLQELIGSTSPVTLSHSLGSDQLKAYIITKLEYSSNYSMHALGNLNHSLTVGLNSSHAEIGISCSRIENAIQAVEAVKGPISRTRVFVQLQIWRTRPDEYLQKTYNISGVGPELITIPHINPQNHLLDIQIRPAGSGLTYDGNEVILASGDPGLVHNAVSTTQVRLWWRLANTSALATDPAPPSLNLHDCAGNIKEFTPASFVVQLRVMRIGLAQKPTCKIPALTHSSVARQGLMVCINSSVELTCDAGYVIPLNVSDAGLNNQTANITCVGNNIWTSQFTCAGPQCGPLEVANSNTSLATGDSGESVMVTCAAGYASLGRVDFTATCLTNASWDVTENCSVIDCGPLPQMDSIEVQTWPTGNVTSLNATAVYVCRHGYSILNGMFSVQCQQNSTWSTPPSCQKDCAELQVSSSLIISSNSTSFNTTVNFSCDNNDTLLGNEYITCNTGGVWSSSAPLCVNITQLDAYIEDGKCILRSCDQLVNQTTWSEWGACTVTCGRSVQFRTFSCEVQLGSGVLCQKVGNEPRFCEGDPCIFERVKPLTLQPPYTESDYRPSAIAMGTMAIGILIGYMIFFLVLDSRHIFKDVQMMIRNIRDLLRRDDTETSCKHGGHQLKDLSFESL